ncbi:MAG: hypothetical protein WBE22_04125 [Halobacteriota archaeon]
MCWCDYLPDRWNQADIMEPMSQNCPKNWVLRHEDLESKYPGGREA